MSGPPDRSLSPPATPAEAPTFRAHTKPTLDDLKLSNILNGETCPPISFADFASFISNKEFSSENLLFVIWYQSYQRRYGQLDPKTRNAVPVPSTRLGDRYAPYAYLDKVFADAASGKPAPSPMLEGGLFWQQPFAAKLEERRGSVASSCRFKPCTWTVDSSECTCTDPSNDHGGPSRLTCGKRHSQSSSRQTHSPLPKSEPTSTSSTQVKPATPPLPPEGTDFLDPTDQPLRQEAQRAFATFLRKGGSKELSIADEVRQFAKITLARSTAPEVFQAVFDEVYHVIETQSLPHFLTYVRSNINRPKQIFWYIAGGIDLMTGLVMFLVLTLLLPNHRFAFRAIRVPSVLFVCVGCMQLYSAMEGFCSQVWGRSSRQIRPWEMDEYEDEEAGTGPAMLHRINSSKSEDIFTPVLDTQLTLGVTLPYEAHPLSDLGGTASTSSTSPPWERAMSAVPGPDEILTEVHERQLAIRRATVKVPDTSLAFPIAASACNPPRPQLSARSSLHVNPAPALHRPHTSRHDLNDIAPFDNNSPPGDCKIISNLPSDPRGDNSLDLPALIGKYGREPPMRDEEKRVRVFGPERLVEDPRVTALFEGVVRRILIVGGVSAAIWTAMCFVVPMPGLY